MSFKLTSIVTTITLTISASASAAPTLHEAMTAAALVATAGEFPVEDWPEYRACYTPRENSGPSVTILRRFTSSAGDIIVQRARLELETGRNSHPFSLAAGSRFDGGVGGWDPARSFECPTGSSQHPHFFRAQRFTEMGAAARAAGGAWSDLVTAQILLLNANDERDVRSEFKACRSARGVWGRTTREYPVRIFRTDAESGTFFWQMAYHFRPQALRQPFNVKNLLRWQLDVSAPTSNRDCGPTEVEVPHYYSSQLLEGEPID